MSTIERSTDFRRRPFLLEPGDPLLLEPDPIRVMVNFGRFSEETGVPPSSLVTSRLCALPVPKGSIRSWLQVRPEATFLPLLWLPPHLAEAKSYVIGDDGIAHTVSPAEAGGAELFEESEEDWAVRVALELTASGFYDAESGTFLDVMALVGIDLDTEEGLGRVRSWLSGANDDDLDLLATGLELEGHLKSSAEPDWALNEVLVERANLVNCAYAAGTEALSETLVELRDALEAGHASLSDAKTLLETVCLGAASWLDDLPLEEPADQTTMSEDDWWMEQVADAQDFSGEPAAFVAERLELALARLQEINEAARPFADAFLAEAEATGDDTRSPLPGNQKPDGNQKP